MEVAHVDYFIEENSVFEGAKHVLSRFRPQWDLDEVKFKVFTDGITNKLLGCFYSRDQHDVILIRINGNKTDLLIDRKSEIDIIKYLYQANLAPALYGTFDNGLVYKYVPGVTVTSVTCREEGVSTLIARNMADMHRVNAVGPVPEPVLWTLIEKFTSQIPEKFSSVEKEKRFIDTYPSRLNLKSEISFLKKELSQLNSPVVICHNDLLLANIIYNQDEKTVTFIDYEYSGYNYQAFDIANHFNEFAGLETVDYSLYPDETFQRRWLRTYLEWFGRTGSSPVEPSAEDVQALLSTVEKFTLASHFFWGIWALLQAEYSSIHFDFINYAFIRLKEYYKVKKRIFF